MSSRGRGRGRGGITVNNSREERSGRGARMPALIAEQRDSAEDKFDKREQQRAKKRVSSSVAPPSMARLRRGRGGKAAASSPARSAGGSNGSSRSTPLNRSSLPPSSSSPAARNPPATSSTRARNPPQPLDFDPPSDSEDEAEFTDEGQIDGGDDGEFTAGTEAFAAEEEYAPEQEQDDMGFPDWTNITPLDLPVPDQASWTHHQAQPRTKKAHDPLETVTFEVEEKPLSTSVKPAKPTSTSSRKSKSVKALTENEQDALKKLLPVVHFFILSSPDASSSFFDDSVYEGGFWPSATEVTTLCRAAAEEAGVQDSELTNELFVQVSRSLHNLNTRIPRHVAPLVLDHFSLGSKDGKDVIYTPDAPKTASDIVGDDIRRSIIWADPPPQADANVARSSIFTNSILERAACAVLQVSETGGGATLPPEDAAYEVKRGVVFGAILLGAAAIHHTLDCAIAHGKKSSNDTTTASDTSGSKKRATSAPSFSRDAYHDELETGYHRFEQLANLNAAEGTGNREQELVRRVYGAWEDFRGLGKRRGGGTVQRKRRVEEVYE